MANVGNIAGVLKNSTALKPLMSTADDLAIYGLRYVNPDMNDANKAAKKFMDYKAAGRSLSEGATAAVVNYANHHKEQIGKEDGLFQALNPAVNTAESLMQYVVGADLAVIMGLPLLGGVVGVLGLKEAEPIVMLGGDAQVLHPRLLGQVEPGVGIELHRVPALRQLCVFRAWDAPPPLVLPAVDRVDAPVNEHPKPLLEPPIPPVPESRGEFRCGIGVGASSRTGRFRISRRRRQGPLPAGQKRQGCQTAACFNKPSSSDWSLHATGSVPPRCWFCLPRGPFRRLRVNQTG